MFTLERITHESKYKEKYVRECEISNENYSLRDLARNLNLDSRNCVFKVNDEIISNESIQNYNINDDDLIQIYVLPIDYMFFLPTLKIFADGLKHPRQEIFNRNAVFFNFPQEILEKRTSGGGNISHEVKSERAVTRLKKFGMIELDNEGYYITEKGLSLLNENKDLRREDIEEYEIINFNEKYTDEHRNLIYFGAPGTGKSFNLDKDVKELLEDEFNENYERVTFHPDYSYANFVGSYKPVMNDDEIAYDYVPGPFMRSLVKSYNNPHEPFILIIEEINRANVAGVFGEVFQLLDRDDNNVSRYPIQTSMEMRNYLKEELNEWCYIDDVSNIKIPSNLFIWATMNSADQGVFPIDTAFKRRWNFKYFGINDSANKISKLKFGNIYWNDVREAINDMLLSKNVNEDKLLGPFFAFNEYIPENETITKYIPNDKFKEIFKNKIIMYLFEDVAKSFRKDLFKGAKENDKSYVTYSSICKKFDEMGFDIFHEDILNKLQENNNE